MAKRQLTNSQLVVWTAVRDFKAENDGNSPTVMELADDSFLTKSTVQYHLDQLELRGYILRDTVRVRIFLCGGEYTPPETPQKFVVHGYELG